MVFIRRRVPPLPYRDHWEQVKSNCYKLVRVRVNGKDCEFVNIDIVGVTINVRTILKGEVNKRY